LLRITQTILERARGERSINKLDAPWGAKLRRQLIIRRAEGGVVNSSNELEHP
jgi:hypothetical protein